MPLRYRAEAGFQEPEWGHHLRMVGRLAAGATLAQALTETRSIGQSPTPEFSRPAWAPMSDGLIVESLLDSMTISVRPALLAILGAVFVLLAIACVNLSNLLLARTLARRAELAIRTALGAGSAQLLRQLVTESLVITLAGGHGRNRSCRGDGGRAGIARARVARACRRLPDRRVGVRARAHRQHARRLGGRRASGLERYSRSTLTRRCAQARALRTRSIASLVARSS